MNSSTLPLRRKTTPATVHHRYRLEHGIYPENMRGVVTELCDEIERLQEVADEIDAAFYRWRQNHYARTEDV